MNAMNFDTILSGIRQSWATCIAPEPAPEWRLLEQGEVILKGDEGRMGTDREFDPKAYGMSLNHPLANNSWEVRRRVRMQSDGWRFIDAGETVTAGDEALLPLRQDWIPITGGIGEKYLENYVNRFTPRRKVS